MQEKLEDLKNKVTKNKKKLGYVGAALVVALSVMAFSSTRLDSMDLELAAAICEPAGGLHSIVTGPLGTKAVQCTQRGKTDYICLDRVVDQEKLRDVDGLLGCLTPNNASDEEVQAALARANQNPAN